MEVYEIIQKLLLVDKKILKEHKLSINMLHKLNERYIEASEHGYSWQIRQTKNAMRDYIGDLSEAEEVIRDNTTDDDLFEGRDYIP